MLIADLEALLAKATPGKWTIGFGRENGGEIGMSQGDPEFQMQMSAYTRITQLEAENARLTADLNLGSDLSYQFMKQDRDALATENQDRKGLLMQSEADVRALATRCRELEAALRMVKPIVCGALCGVRAVDRSKVHHVECAALDAAIKEEK